MKDAADAFMDTVQAKLKENLATEVSDTTVNRLTNILGNVNTIDSSNVKNKTVMTAEPDSMDVCASVKSTTKDHSKIPTRSKRNSKKHSIPMVAGQQGARFARTKVSKAKKRGQIYTGVKVTKKRNLKKKKNVCAF